MDDSKKSSEQENTSNTAPGDTSQSSGEEQSMSNTQSEETSSVASSELTSGSSAESSISTAPGAKLVMEALKYDWGTWTVRDLNNPNIVLTSQCNRREKIEDMAGEDAQQVSDSEQQGKLKKQKLDPETEDFVSSVLNLKDDDEDCKTAAGDDVLKKLQKKKDDRDDDTVSGDAGLTSKWKT